MPTILDQERMRLSREPVCRQCIDNLIPNIRLLRRQLNRSIRPRLHKHRRRNGKLARRLTSALLHLRPSFCQKSGFSERKGGRRSPEAKRTELSHTPPRSSVGDDPSIHTDRWRQGAVRSLLLVPVVAGLTPCLEVGRVEEEPPVSLVILQVMDDRAVRCWRLAYQQPAASLCLAGLAIPDKHLLADASSAPPCLKGEQRTVGCGLCRAQAAPPTQGGARMISPVRSGPSYFMPPALITSAVLTSRFPSRVPRQSLFPAARSSSSIGSSRYAYSLVRFF